MTSRRPPAATTESTVNKALRGKLGLVPSHKNSSLAVGSVDLRFHSTWAFGCSARCRARSQERTSDWARATGVGLESVMPMFAETVPRSSRVTRGYVNGAIRWRHHPSSPAWTVKGPCNVLAHNVCVLVSACVLFCSVSCSPFQLLRHEKCLPLCLRMS